METLNELEKYYFHRLKDIFEKNGTSFVKNLTSQYLFNGIEETYSGKSGIADVMERVVQSIISNNTDWEIFSHPASSDSSFLTPKAVIHIDCKSTLDTDGDAIQNKVDLGRNQTSFATDTPIMYLGVPFKSNLPTIYNHFLYGNLYTLTYIVKIAYNLNDGINSLRNFKIYLCSIPNGLMQDELGIDFVIAGREKTKPFYKSLENEEYTNLVGELNEVDERTFNQSYYYDEDNGKYKIYDWLNINANSLNSEQKELKTSLKELYSRKNFNLQREKLRVKLLEIPIDGGNQYKWNRYQQLTLK